MKLKTGLVYSSEFQKHVTGAGHPERPQRTEAIYTAIPKADFVADLVPIKPAPAAHEDLLRCHMAEYIETAKRDVASGAGLLSTGDTNICRDSYDIALLAAGGIIKAVDGVCRGELKNAFCVVRPPGHHATPTKGMGFCLFDNIAIGARYAQAKHGIKRVLIVDWDVHHGNGTQDIFYSDGTVLFLILIKLPCIRVPVMRANAGRAKDSGSRLTVLFRRARVGLRFSKLMRRNFCLPRRTLSRNSS